MKEFCSKLSVMLVAVAATGLAQAPTTAATQSPSSQPAISSPAPAPSATTLPAPRLSGESGSGCYGIFD